MDGDVVVTVIVPVFNTEKYLRKAIKSVIEQSFTLWELILVDDGSSDRSGSICDEYAKADVRIHVFHTENKGVSNARNLGIENASGTWIVFLDSDDYMDKNMLKTLLSYSSNMGLVECSIMEIPEYKKLHMVDRVTYYESMKDSLRDIDKLFSSSFYSSPVNKLYKRDKITMRFNPMISWGEDFCFNLEYMSKCGAICVVPDTLYYYRVFSEESLTKRVWINVIDIRKMIFNYILKYMGTDKIIVKYASRDFISSVVSQCVMLSDSKYSWSERKEIMDSWVCNGFFSSDMIDWKSAKNKRHWLVLQLMKRKMSWAVLLLSWVFVLKQKYVDK